MSGLSQQSTCDIFYGVYPPTQMRRNEEENTDPNKRVYMLVAEYEKQYGPLAGKEDRNDALVEEELDKDNEIFPPATITTTETMPARETVIMKARLECLTTHK